MVLLSGCSMLPGGGGGGGDVEPDGPAYHSFSFASDTGGAAFEATLTVEKDGSVIHEETVSSDGSRTFAELGQVEEPGPYTVTVNTTIPAAGSGNTSKRAELNGTLGTETVVDVTYLGISFESHSLPEQEMAEPLYFKKDIPMEIASTVVVSYEGETVFSDTVERQGTEAVELADLPETGVYHVAVSGSHGERWENRTVVLSDPGEKLFVGLDGDTPEITVYAPGEGPSRQ
ncbi:hypothetical protein [Halobacterium wangiae]|uniref:hypothetical protein n=1 Tax=Halobacterium wangiae TaxID=2902623 RepID=UPI001E6213D9|nr:hypothetical protein [Halobacterium wangiae]